MRYRAVAASLLFVPFPAAAAGGGEGGFSFAASLVQMLGSLALVLGLIYLGSYLSRRWFKGRLRLTGLQNCTSYIRIVETRHLAPKKSLLLVEVSGEYLLLSNGSEGISLIKQIDMLEEIEVIEVLGRAEYQVKGRFQEKLEEFMTRMQAPRLMTFGPRNEQ
jgi:flagellar protein FliO/FliZ